MGHYKIIQDDAAFRSFIEWLPELELNEVFYVALFARKKYDPALKYTKTDKTQLKRFTSKKDLLYHKIKQLEVEVGSFVLKGHEATQQSLAVYISPNPRDLWKATKTGLIKFAQLVTQPYNGHNPHQEIMSEIQKAWSRKIYLDFDFDGVDKDETLHQIWGHLNPECITVLNTHSGFHLLIELKKIAPEYKKTWYQRLSQLPGCDVQGDNLIPIVGCTQGGRVPYFDA
jgi:hypothetical protein